MKIIAVDDEKLGLEALIASIKKAIPDCEVEGFREPQKALEYAKTNKIDVAFLDVRMPQMKGTELAQKLKIINPSVNIIFQTGFDEYQQEAFRLHASGYILKPVTPDKVSDEIENLRYPVEIDYKKDDKLTVKTFGNFEMFWEKMPIKFKYDKTKEMFAVLIDKRGALVSNGELMAYLWEDDTHESYLRGIKKDLNDTFKKLGLSSLIIVQRGKLGIAVQNVNCDYYEFLEGDPHALNQYQGEYMSQYSWAELTNASLLKDW